MSDRPAKPGPLGGLPVIERFGPGSSDAGRIAVSFAGLLAARFGAAVTRVEPEGGDPVRNWPPLMEDGSSALFRFLSAGKTLVAADHVPPEGAFLLTDDAAAAAVWPSARRVLVADAFGLPSGRRESELTLMAASGLLDMIGDPGEPPLPLPGYQMGYCGGLAAYDALLASHLAERLHGTLQPAAVSLLDVACWANWKHRLPNVSGARESGINRREEWFVVRCRDGYIAPIFQDRHIKALAELTRSKRLLEPELARSAARREHLEEFRAIITEALADRGRDEIMAEAERLGLPFAAVFDPAEIASDPQMRFRGFIIREDDVLMPRVPLLWNGAPLPGGESEAAPGSRA